MGNKKKTVYNFIFSFFSQIITIAMGLIIPRITLVGYGSEINGLLNSVTQFIAYLIVFEAGIQIVATQALYKSVGEKDFNETNEILSAINKSYQKIGVFYFCGLLFLSIIYSFFTKIESVNYVTIFLVVFFSGLGNVISFFFQGKYKILLTVEGKSYILTNINMIISILNHVVKIILLYIGVNVSIVIIASFILSLGQMGYIVAYIKKVYQWIDLRAKPKFAALKQNKSALIHQISGLIFSNTDILLLTIVCGLKIVSVYSIYKLINDYVFNFLKISIDSCSFIMGQKYNIAKDEYLKDIDTLEICWALMTFSIFSLVLYFILPFISLYTRGVEDIEYVNYVVAVLFVICDLLNVSRLPMLNTINYAGHFEQTTWRTVTESIINVVISVFGVFKFGIYGVLIGTIAALLYRTTDIIIYANRKLLNRSPKKTFSIYGLNVFLFVVMYSLMRKMPIIINTYWQFIKYGLIFTPIVVGIFLIVNYLVFKKDLKNVSLLLKKN